MDIVKWLGYARHSQFKNCMARRWKLSYDSYLKGLTILKVSVVAISKQLYEPFGKMLSWRAESPLNDNVMDGYVQYYSARIELCLRTVEDNSKKCKSFWTCSMIPGPNMDSIGCRCDAMCFFGNPSKGKEFNIIIAQVGQMEFLEVLTSRFYSGAVLVQVMHCIDYSFLQLVGTICCSTL
ncbi:uncharacterized protein LOC130759115 [Actinidia eriantha]|uniref:uncharacterized protein LOC130759115 n=1 Tax=Actinidia eriantha TaxID=165200 RepID=UPI002586BFEF|nr:uncharacterized protein LOC130759115 [Actinidia eriantha]